MLNIVLFGPPGAGKGTQSKKLVADFNLVHLSTGDMLRAERKSGSELGQRVSAIIDAGELVSDEIVIELIATRLDNNADAAGFIFDGFPRTIAQAEALDRLLSEKDTSISCMISLKVPEEELVTRLLQRGRKDDNEETIRNRVGVYQEETLPVAGYYQKQAKLNEIDGVGTVEEIAQRVATVLKAYA